MCIYCMKYIQLLTTDKSFTFEYECEETSFLDDYEPVELQIHVKDATVSIRKISLSDEKQNNVRELNQSKRLEKNSQKLVAVQEYIKRKGLLWTAAETEFSKMSYSDKAKYWGKNYASFGYEYYAGGIYSAFSPSDRGLVGDPSICHGFVDNFDWRSRHGANKPSSPYYDGDVNGSGWMTPVVCQGRGCWVNNHYHCNKTQSWCDGMGGIYRGAATCWAFGPVAQVEALVNLYYNQHIDVKLSEQYIMCMENKDVAWYTANSFNYFKNTGVPDAACLPYSAALDNCNTICSNPYEKIKINNYSSHTSSSVSYDLLRNFVMTKGPVTVSKTSFPWYPDTHAMVLVGWGTIDENTPEGIEGIPYPISSDWYGYNYWIHKQSGGPTAYVNGYEYVVSFGTPGTTYVVDLPITSLNRTDANIRCVDEDGDGYYFWGIGTKPAHCPQCPDEPDGDDSNPSLGPMNAFGQCTIIDTYTASFESGWDNWIQVGTDDGDWWRHSGPVYNGSETIFGAQNGNYYIYVNSTCNGCYPSKKFIIESPPINLSNKSCEAQINFYYHMNTGLWGNPDYTKLELQISYDNGQTWVQNYWFKEHNQGAGWKHATVRFPSSVNKVRFVGKTGLAFMSDIALDNITIVPAPKDPDLIINSNSTWNTNQRICRNVVITNNSTLTISNCNISLYKDVFITIAPGGKLILDGGTLTNACPNQMWQRVVVQGDINVPMQQQYQGYIELTNGGKIENAVCGVTV